MIKFLVKKTIKNYQDTENTKVREKYGVLSGILGIICNLFLCSLKLIIGFLMSSMAIISDGFNNLSDSGSSIISIFSAKLSNKKPDKDHPFGHGRVEYISSLLVSFLIIFMGVELLISSFEKLINKEFNLDFNPYLLIALAISILVKIWMFFYNRYLSKQINSLVLKATASDSLQDALVTSIIVIATIVNHYFLKNFPLDSILGTIIAILIIFNGLKLTLDTSKTLLGNPPSQETINKISQVILQNKKILGIHDLMVHDYGPGRKIASVHAEVSDQENITYIHELIDSIEKKVENELGITMVIHMDPINTSDPEVLKIKEYLNLIISSYNKSLSFHDLRITKGEKNINVIFDLVINYDYSKEDLQETIKYIKTKLHEFDNRYSCVINIDYQ